MACHDVTRRRAELKFALLSKGERIAAASVKATFVGSLLLAPLGPVAKSPQTLADATQGPFKTALRPDLACRLVMMIGDTPDPSFANPRGSSARMSPMLLNFRIELQFSS